MRQVYYNTELYHYGIKGMKWGVRRYQNKDGTLTQAGKEKYRTRRLTKIDANNMERDEFVKIMRSGDDFMVKKGQSLYRTTSVEQEKTNGKKYLTLRADDVDTYVMMVGDNDGLSSKDYFTVKYSNVKDLRIAGAKTQTEILQSIYGMKVDKKSPWFSELEGAVASGRVNKENITKPVSKMTKEEFDDYFYYNPFNHDIDLLTRPTSDKDVSRFMNELSKRGYDAVVDMADLRIGYSDGAVVVLKTEDALNRENSWHVLDDETSFRERYGYLGHGGVDGTMHYNTELYHYGVKGMKWGVRKEYEKSNRPRRRKQSEDDDVEKRKGLTDKQKKYIKVGAAVVATALVTYGAYKLYTKNGIPQFAEGAAIEGLKKKTGVSSVADDVRAVNRLYNTAGNDYKMNCGNCSIAYELRRRGYDVAARANPNGMMISQFGEFFNNLSQDSFADVPIQNGVTGTRAIKDAVSKTISSKYPEGSRGTMLFPHKFGNHFINWEVGKSGNVLFTDSQIGNANVIDMFGQYKRRNGYDDIKCIRLDNLEVNSSRIQAVISNVGEKVSRTENFNSYVSQGQDFVMRFR